jgi:hypothetical protein
MYCIVYISGFKKHVCLELNDTWTNGDLFKYLLEMKKLCFGVMLLTCFTPVSCFLFFDPEDEGDMFLRNLR